MEEKKSSFPPLVFDDRQLLSITLDRRGEDGGCMNFSIVKESKSHKSKCLPVRLPERFKSFWSTLLCPTGIGEQR